MTATPTRIRIDPPSDLIIPAIPDRDRYSLPVPLTSLVGRDGELDLINELLGRSDVRLVALTGPAGVGKTRLALELAANQPDDHFDRVWFVSLADVDNPAAVIPAIARALDVREFGDRPLFEVLVAALRPRTGLLVLDNAEQVIEAAPDLAALLQACPSLTLLVTSREPLRLSGEHEVRIDPLTVPSEQAAATAGPAQPAQFDAVRLFVERARAVQPGFAPSADTLATVGAICRHLDGLPLAIELAAAMTRVFSPAALLDRLTASEAGSLPILVSGPRDRPRRQQTLRDAIAWSYDLLSEPERGAFRALSVFSGGFTLAQAERTIGAGGAVTNSPLATLSALVEKSLVVAYPWSDLARFCLLTTIREFGRDLLATAPEEQAIRQTHAAMMLELAESWDQTLLGPGYAEVTVQFDAEWRNFKAALDFASASGADATLVALAAALAQLWRLRGMHGEGTHWLGLALARGEAGPPRDRARALVGAGLLETMRCDYPSGLDAYEQALAICRGLGDRLLTARTLFHMIEATTSVGDEDRALSLIDEARDLAAGRDEALSALIEKARGELERRQGRFDRAEQHLATAQGMTRELGFTWGEADTLLSLAATARDKGDLDGAARYLTESLALYSRLQDWIGIANVAVGVAWLAPERGYPVQALRLYAAAGALFESLGLREPRHKYVDHQRWLTGVRSLVGAEADHVWDRGRTLAPEQIGPETADLAAAIGDTAPGGNGSRSPIRQAGLSVREEDVLRWVAAGLTNAEVAERLFISPRTVNAHLTRIYGKLDVPSRAAAIRFAVDHGLAADQPSVVR